MKSLIKKSKSFVGELRSKLSKYKRRFDILLNRWIFHIHGKELKNKQKILLLATPTYLNVGDLAIVYATKKWLSEKFNFPIIEFHEEELKTYIPILKKLVNANDVIVLPGGGNLSDRYDLPEIHRHYIVSNFPENKIIILPQSVFFYNELDEHSQLKKSQQAYSNHKNLTICTRDRHSFKLAKKYFSKNKIECFPDMFFYCDNQFIDNSVNRNDILLCLRNDIEGKFSEKDFNDLLCALKKLNLKCSYQDTHLTNIRNDFFKYRAEINKEERTKVVTDMALLFNKYRVVITDRFHGFIFSYITNTPCVLLNSEDHKIREGLEWIKNSNFIFYIGDDYSKIVDSVEKALNVIPKKTVDFRNEYFMCIEKLLR